MHLPTTRALRPFASPQRVQLPPCTRHNHKVNSSKSPFQDVASLNEGLSTQERISNEIQSGVSDVVDTDRTAELLLWVWESLFKPKAKTAQAPITSPTAPPRELELAVFGGGCFWCLDAVFRQVQGVQSVICGYAGGHTDTKPTYELVCSGSTGHAEVVQLAYDPTRVSYAQLLRVFMSMHDASTAGRQGDDLGTQYRSIIVCTSEQQHQAAQQVLQQATEEGWYASGTPTTEVLQALTALDSSTAPAAGQDQVNTRFWPAEPQHQNYMAVNGSSAYCVRNILPKLQKLNSDFPELAESQVP